MHNPILKILFKWLKQAGYNNFDKQQFEISFLSHPDIGKLNAITDTLTEFGIENTAANIPSDSLDNLNEPFLAFVQQNNAETFVLTSITNQGMINVFDGEGKAFNLSKEYFKEIWTGIIVVVEKCQKAKNVILSNSFIAGPLMLCLLVILLIVLSAQDILTVLFFLLSCIGLAVSGTIVSHELGNNSSLLNKFCNQSKKASCDVVLNSKLSKVYKNVGFSDLGIVYFSFQLLLYLFTNSTENQLLFCTSIIAAVFIFYSVYIQSVVIKKWCPLCIATITVLLLQATMSIVSINKTKITSSILQLSYYVIILLLVVLIWYFIKPILKRSVNGKLLEIAYFSFKRNYRLFLPYYQLQKPFAPITSLNFDDIIIGNENALLQLTLITDPICPNCTRVHETINKLLVKYPDDIQVKLVFNVPIENENDKGGLVAMWLCYQYFKDNKAGAKAINDWYKYHDFAIVSKEIKHEKLLPVKPIIQMHRQWCLTNNLTMTPLLLINNKLFPAVYNPTDVEYFIAELIQAESSNTNAFVFANKVLVDNT